MRLTLLAWFLLGIAACSHDDNACEGECKTTQSKYDMASRSVHAANQEDFVDDDGTTYTLVRIEYGSTQVCDDFGEDCGYSTYCGFVAGGQEYPVSFDFVTDADVLFDTDQYCDDLGCDLPGNDLAILDNDDFDDWLWNTDVEDDVLISCFDD